MKSNQVVLLACALATGALAFPGAQEVANLQKRHTGTNAEVSVRSSTNNGVSTEDHAVGYASAYQREKPGHDDGYTTEKAECNGNDGKKWPLHEGDKKLDIEYDPDNHYIGLTSGHAPHPKYVSVSLYAGDNNTDHSNSERMYMSGADLAARRESNSGSDDGCKGKLLGTMSFDFSHASSFLEAHLCVDQKKYNHQPFKCVMWNKDDSEGAS